MKLFGLAGYSGAGKTTLIRLLLPRLIAHGITVSTIKHAHENFEIDKPGKDSYVHRKSGASEVLISGAKRWALLHELCDEREPSLHDLVALMTPVDLLIVEGFKAYPHPKLEVHRLANGKPRLPNAVAKNIIALATDGPMDPVLPSFPLTNITSIAHFIATYVRQEK